MKKTHQQKMGREGKYKSLAKVTTEKMPLEASAGISAEMEVVKHSLEIPGGLHPSFNVKGARQIDRVQAWAEAVLNEAGFSLDWRYALDAVRHNEGSMQWFAANALASVNSTREFIAEGKARDAAETAMWANEYLHEAMLQELTSRVYIGSRVESAPHVGIYSEGDHKVWEAHLSKLVELETFRKSITKTAGEIARLIGKKSAQSAIKKHLQDKHRARFDVKPRRK